MLGNWLTAGRLDRQTVRGGESGEVVLGARFNPEPLTGGLERMRRTKTARASAKPESRGTKARSFVVELVPPASKADRRSQDAAIRSSLNKLNGDVVVRNPCF